MVIIFDIVGITCDVIEVWLDLDGILVMLLDMAGLWDTDDSVESFGVACVCVCVQ